MEEQGTQTDIGLGTRDIQGNPMKAFLPHLMVNFPKLQAIAMDRKLASMDQGKG